MRFLCVLMGLILVSSAWSQAEKELSPEKVEALAECMELSNQDISSCIAEDKTSNPETMLIEKGDIIEYPLDAEPVEVSAYYE